MLRISVKVIPRSSQEKVEYFDDLRLLKVWTKAAPVDGKANEAVIELVAKYLSVNKKSVQITLGKTSKTKIVEIETDKTEDELIKKQRLF